MMPEKTPITGKEDKTSLRADLQVLVEFYDAFNSRDLDRVLRNWAQRDDIVMNNPIGGIKRGWKEIKTVYERIFGGSAQVYVEFYDYTIYKTSEMFYAVGRERGEFHSGETPIKLAIRTTRIYRLLDGQWYQVHHHGSIDDPHLLAQYQSAVKTADS